MTPAFRHHDAIVRINKDDEAYLECKEDTPNNYGDDAPVIPKGTIIRVDFGHHYGVYGKVDVGGVVMKCQIDLKHFNNLKFVEKPQSE